LSPGIYLSSGIDRHRKQKGSTTFRRCCLYSLLSSDLALWPRRAHHIRHPVRP